MGKSAITSLGKGAIGVAKDVLAGKDFKESALDGLKEAGEDILDNTLDTLSGKKRKAPARRYKRVQRRRIIF